eukprot:348869_1
MENDFKPVGCWKRFKLLTTCFHHKRIEIKKHEDSVNGSEISVTIIPEAFRTWFYIGFWIFFLFAVIITEAFSSTFNREDNPIIDRFGMNNMCIYFDFAPFTYMGAFLWIICGGLLIIYLITDEIRVYVNYANGLFGKTFFIIYTIFFAWHLFAMAYFVQCFATSPFESIEIHYMGYFFIQVALFTLSFIHYIYFMKLNIIKKGDKYYAVGIVYLVLLAITIIIKSMINIPNVLFKAQLWINWGPWTNDVLAVNDKVFMFLTTICPIIIYLFFIDDCDQIRLTFKTNRKFKFDPSKTNHAERVELLTGDASL